MEKENSLVSIYITNYNYGNFIEEAIESALNQSYKNIEIFIIDDGSNDDSRDIINSYLSIPKIKVVFQKNLGLTKSNNVALRLANGKYIVRLDADDRLKIDAIENLINGFVSDDVAMVFGNWDVIDENGNLIFNFKRHDFENDVSLMDCPAHGACTMFRVDYLRSIGGYDEDLKCQDGYELWFRIIDKFKVRNLEVSIFDYRRHGANLTGNEERILSTRSRILKKISSEKGKQVDAFAFIPIRGSLLDKRSTPLEQIADKYILDIVLEEIIDFELFRKVVVSTPDKNIISHINKCYSNKIILDERDFSSSMINQRLNNVIGDFLDKNISFKDYSHCVMFGIDRPFNKKYLVQSALDIASIFNVNNVVGVRPTEDIFFNHTGKTLKGINFEKDGLRLERDELYQMVKGFNVFSIPHFIKEKSIWGDIIGHVVFDQKTSFSINSQFDLQIANLFYQS